MSDERSIPLSLLDLAPIAPGQTAGESFAASVRLAQTGEEAGYRRVWYAEHHSMATIASSAPAVLIAHIAAHTTTIRLGAGGVMLPNHAPLTIAEQYGTLAELHPGRIDLGLGRAPGSDRTTMRALRRDASSSEAFPQDVRELQGYLADSSLIDGVRAVPGAGTKVPLYILGSSLSGAQLAAAFGLPFAFASHFAPDLLLEASARYRAGFTPSEQLAEPHMIAAVNVIAAESDEDARVQHGAAVRHRVRLMIARGPEPVTYSDEQIDAFLTTPQGAQIADMMRYTAVGAPAEVREYLLEFARHAQADELITAHAALDLDARLASVRLTAEAMRPVLAA